MSKAVRVYANLLDVVLVVNVDGVGLILRHEDIPDLRDQLNAMFPPEPVESPAKVEADVAHGAPCIFFDTGEQCDLPYKIRRPYTGTTIWLSRCQLTQLYTELQAHFGDDQNSTNPKQVDTPIDWAGERWEIAVDTPINWEVRRWEAAKAFMAVNIPLEIYSTVDPEDIANASIAQADDLIARYRAEPNGGGA